MTLEELKNMTVTITLNKSFKIVDDLGEDILKEIVKDPNVLDSLSTYYNSIDNIMEVISDYKITIE